MKTVVNGEEGYKKVMKVVLGEAYLEFMDVCQISVDAGVHFKLGTKEEVRDMVSKCIKDIVEEVKEAGIGF